MWLGIWKINENPQNSLLTPPKWRELLTFSTRLVEGDLNTNRWRFSAQNSDPLESWSASKVLDSLSRRFLSFKSEQKLYKANIIFLDVISTINRRIYIAFGNSLWQNEVFAKTGVFLAKRRLGSRTVCTGCLSEKCWNSDEHTLFAQY